MRLAFLFRSETTVQMTLRGVKEGEVLASEAELIADLADAAGVGPEKVMMTGVETTAEP